MQTKSNWTLCFELQIAGEDALGEQYKSTENVVVPLKAGRVSGAEKEAKLFVKNLVEIARRENREELKQLCGLEINDIQDEDGVEFGNFRLVFTSVQELYPLVPSILAGP